MHKSEEPLWVVSEVVDYEPLETILVSNDIPSNGAEDKLREFMLREFKEAFDVCHEHIMQAQEALEASCSRILHNAMPLSGMKNGVQHVHNGQVGSGKPIVTKPVWSQKALMHTSTMPVDRVGIDEQRKLAPASSRTTPLDGYDSETSKAREQENSATMRHQTMPAWTQARSAPDRHGTHTFDNSMLHTKDDAHGQRGLFDDVADMKMKVRSKLLKPEYSVCMYYWDTGIFRTIATNHAFEHATLAVIFINACWIAYDADKNPAASLLDAQTQFVFAENFFCSYFLTEWFIRFMSFRRKRNCIKDAWFVFDSCLVVTAVVETWVITLVTSMMSSGGGSPLGNASMLRLLRLLRLTRMARMLRSMPELMILIKGMVAATRSVFFTMCLLLIVNYVFAIAMRQLTEGTEAGEQYFNSIPRSMYTLLIHGTFLDDLAAVSDLILESSVLILFVFLMFICVAALMVMNMLIGVLCEVVSKVAETEKEEMTVTYMKHKIERIVKALDSNSDMTISRTEFLQILDNGEALALLDEVGVDPIGLIELQDSLFPYNAETGKETQMEFATFMEAVLNMRGSNQATRKDIMQVIHWMQKSFDDIQNKLLPLATRRIAAPRM
jgi:hypothetical protein